MSGDITRIASLIEKGPNAIFLHSNADLDCAGAALALAVHYGNSSLHAPAGVSHLGKKLMARFGTDAVPDFDSANGKNILVVDAQSDSSLGYGGVDWSLATVIDHHSQTEKCTAPRSFLDPKATSCCELVWEIMGRPDNIGQEAGFALMAGIIADTGHLKRGTARTLANASEILAASGLCLEDVQAAFESAEDQDISKRISRLKGAQRMRFERIGEWVVAATETGAFESAACHALLSIGADVAFAASRKEGGFRITGRANQAACIAGMHLGEMFSAVAAECDGEGGGHDGAAGLTGSGDAEAFLNICMVRAMKSLKGKERQ